MKHVSILVAREAVLACVDDPRSLFLAVNDFVKADGRPPVFDVHLVGACREVPLHNGRFTVHTDLLLHEVKKTDLIFVPAIACDYKTGIEANQELIPWIQKHYAHGAEVASLCIGAFLLASTGLLDGRKCSTHWLHANNFRAMFPAVELTDDRIVTEDNGVYTSGGATNYFNLLLHLIEKYAGRETAVYASKYFAIEIDRTSQSPFTMFHGQKGHDDEPVKKAQEFIETNYQDKISVEQLAYMFALGRRSLERRFKKATKNTVAEYITRVKMEAAKKDLETGGKNINEVMYEVGYTDHKAFRTTFKKITGLLPVDYRNKYYRQAEEA